MTTPITLANGADAYTTRDGREVRLFTVEGRTPGYPVQGEMYLDCGSYFTTATWTADGKYSVHGDDEGCCDLIPKPVRHKRTYWVNQYPECNGSRLIYDSREHADRAACKERIACIKVELEFAEGEGIT